MTFNERYGPWALVTGARPLESERFARQLAEIGLNVAIVARTESPQSPATRLLFR
jgi:short-subunit dehydrogenase